MGFNLGGVFSPNFQRPLAAKLYPQSEKNLGTRKKITDLRYHQGEYSGTRSSHATGEIEKLLLFIFWVFNLFLFVPDT